MKKLIAVKYILFDSLQYAPGSELPTDDAKMVDLWVKNGSAKWEEETTEEKTPVTVSPAAARAGLAGDADPKSEEDLVGENSGRTSEA